MKKPLPPEREGSTRRRRAGEGLSIPGNGSDKAYDRTPTTRSRDLRNNSTPAERKLWAALGNRRLGGVRFNRQVVIRPYICDFVARTQKLVIEIDGGHHADQSNYDGTRTAFLEARGYRVLRFWNNEVLENIEGVQESIEAELINRPSPSRLRRSSPPASAGGEEWQ